MAEEPVSERMCIVTRERDSNADLIRFVAGPDGDVVPDLAQNLPGRGCWVGAKRSLVEKAVAKGLFAKALKTHVKAGDGLADLVDRLMAANLLGRLGMARKAGQAVLGSTKIDAAIRGSRVAAVFHATDAATDGVRKLAQAMHAAGRGNEAGFALFTSSEMSLAFGGANVIHAAVLDGGIGRKCREAARQLALYRGETVDGGQNTVDRTVQRTDTE